MLTRLLPTPALLLDQQVLETNLTRMQARADALGVALRPHIKTHKCLEIARRQLELGAVGLTVSTLYEAQLLAEAGFHDLTWAFPLPLCHIPAALSLGREVTLRLMIDSMETLEALEKGAELFDVRPHVWLKVDCGYHRCGVDPDAELALELVKRLSTSRRLLFDGALTHAGHSYHASSREHLEAIARQERDVMVKFKARMLAEGLAVPALSLGSTPTLSAIDHLEGIDEIRPGNYCFNDLSQVVLEVCTPTDCAVSVLTSVVSHQPDCDHCIVDAGALSLSKDCGAVHRNLGSGYGQVSLEDIQVLGAAPMHLEALSQEHGRVVCSDPIWLKHHVRIGTRLRILEQHSCLTVAHFDAYQIISDGMVVGHWKIWRGR